MSRCELASHHVESAAIAATFLRQGVSNENAFAHRHSAVIPVHCRSYKRRAETAGTRERWRYSPRAHLLSLRLGDRLGLDRKSVV